MVGLCVCVYFCSSVFKPHHFVTDDNHHYSIFIRLPSTSPIQLDERTRKTLPLKSLQHHTHVRLPHRTHRQYKIYPPPTSLSGKLFLSLMANKSART